MKGPAYTKEELQLLKSSTPISELIHHPAFKNRSIKGLHNKRRQFLARQTGAKPPEPKKSAYDGRKVKLYQFIKIAEATPERVKQWTK